MSSTIAMKKISYCVAGLLLFILCCYTAGKLFPKAFPLVHIDLTTNQQDILTTARTVKDTLNLGPIEPTSCHEAITFESDIVTQTFVELEGGGKKTFISMIENHLYEPYVWHVRFFAPATVNETSLWFTPTGKLYGFKERLSEDRVMQNLSTQEAQTVAASIFKQHDIDSSLYQLIEPSYITHPAGRVDHTLVYERTDTQLNEGTYRIKITIAGNKVTGLAQYVHVPENFTRRYQEIRSYNNTLGFLGYVLMYILYLLAGCIPALYILSKKRIILWKEAALCSFVIASLQAITQLNQLPLRWMEYDTNSTVPIFLLFKLIQVIAFWMINFSFFTLIIASAEGLTRTAFGNHPQLWKSWSQGCANSTDMLYRTAGGYLLSAFDLLLVVVTYLCTTHFFGWWNPSYALIDPNILATYFPPLSAIALSVQAGFIEECLFRAIPLAGAALIGRYFKKESLFVLIALIVQAFVFGAAHANYPAQPFYARLVELIIPSLIWGITYIRLGLIPVIVCHVLYDIVWFSLPLFISQAQNAWFYQSIVVLIALIPLFIILYQYIKTKQWTATCAASYNNQWIQPQLVPPVITQYEVKEIPLTTKGSIWVIILITLLSWFIPTDHLSPKPNKIPSRIAIQKAADAIIQTSEDAAWQQIKDGLQLPCLWYGNSQTMTQNQFIWQTQKNLYDTLVQKEYLALPGWAIRYAYFEGDIVSRAEELWLRLDANKHMLYFKHTLPESSSGTHLIQQEAEKITLKAIFEKYHLNTQDLERIKAIAHKKPHRTDWEIDYAVLNDINLQKGQLRISVMLNGNTISYMSKYIHVPEEWERANQSQDNILGIIKSIGLLCFALLVIIIFSTITGSTTFSSLPLKKLFALFCFMFLLSVVHIINTIPAIVCTFNTAEPWMFQYGRMWVAYMISSIITNLILSIVVIHAFYAPWKSMYTASNTTVFVYGLSKGMSIGIILFTIYSLFLHYGGLISPAYVHNLFFANTYLPIADIVIHSLLYFVKIAAFFLLYLFFIQKIGSQKTALVLTAMCSAYGITALTTANLLPPIYFALMVCIVSILLLVIILGRWVNQDKRSDFAFITGFYVTQLFVTHIAHGVHMDEITGGIIAIMITLTLSCGITYFLNRTSKICK